MYFYLSRVSASRHVRESAAGWRIVVDREFQMNGAAKVKERLPVSSLTEGRRRTSTTTL